MAWKKKKSHKTNLWRNKLMKVDLREKRKQLPEFDQQCSRWTHSEQSGQWPIRLFGPAAPRHDHRRAAPWGHWDRSAMRGRGWGLVTDISGNSSRLCQPERLHLQIFPAWIPCWALRKNSLNKRRRHWSHEISASNAESITNYMTRTKIQKRKLEANDLTRPTSSR